MSKEMQHTVIEFGRKGFGITTISSPKAEQLGFRIPKDEPITFKIDDWWLLNGYRYPVRYPRGRKIEVLDWCGEHALNAHLDNGPGRTMLFKDETVATMFKLTFSEGN